MLLQGLEKYLGHKENLSIEVWGQHRGIRSLGFIVTSLVFFSRFVLGADALLGPFGQKIHCCPNETCNTKQVKS